MIRCISLSKNCLLREVSLEVRAGEVLCVAGPNGAGKSTLLRLLSGEWLPSAGTVELNGRALLHFGERARAQVLAVLPQASALAAEFTALEVVLMGRTPHLARGESADDMRIAREALAAVEASGLEDRLYTSLSGGERQAVHLARVLAQIWNVPDAHLLLDEPTANLDLAQQHRMLGVTRTFARLGVAVLVILHDLNLAAEYADFVLVLKQGRATAYGRPNEIFTPDNIYSNFGFRALVSPHPSRPVPLIIPE